MESITGRRPLFGVFGRGLAGPDRNGLVLGLAVLAALAAIDASLGTPALLVGLFVLAPFIPAVLGGILATVVVATAAAILGFASPLWDSGFGEAGYWLTSAGVKRAPSATARPSGRAIQICSSTDDARSTVGNTGS